MRHVIDGGQQLRRELPAVGFDAADTRAAKADTVITARASDETNALRLALRLPIGERDLERGVDRFGAGVAEEDVIDPLGEHSCELLRQLEGERVAHLEAVSYTHLRAHETPEHLV